MTHDGEEHRVARRHRARLFDDVGYSRGVRHVGQPDDQRPASLRAHDLRRGGGVVRFDAIGLNDGERVDEIAQMRRTAAWRHAPMDTTAVGEQPDAIARLKRDLAQGQRAHDRVIEHAAVAVARALQSSAIHQHPHRLAALRHVDLGNQLSAPCRRRPAHVAFFVASLIVPQRLEFAAPSGAAHAAPFHRRLPAPDQIAPFAA